MMKYLQKLGEFLILLVTCLPVASILMGLGYWIDLTGLGANSVIVIFMIKVGVVRHGEISVQVKSKFKHFTHPLNNYKKCPEIISQGISYNYSKG